MAFNPLPHMPILGSFNLAANKNMMSKIWTNVVQLYNAVENIEGKGEIARYEQFILFPTTKSVKALAGALIHI